MERTSGKSSEDLRGRTVRLEINNNLIRAPYSRGLASLLTYQKKEFADAEFKQRFKAKYGRKFKSKYRKISKSLYVPQEQHILVSRGMLDRITEYLKDEGALVNIVDHNAERVYPAPKFEYLEKLRPTQKEVIDAVVSNDCGIIDCATAYGKSFIIRQICRIYPSLSIVIATPRISVLKQLYESISESIGKDQVGMWYGAKKIKKRITVVSAKTLRQIEPEKTDLLLYDEVHNVGDNVYADEVSFFLKARRFGFTASAECRSSGDDLVTESLFGRPIYKVSYKDAQEHGLVVPIKVLFVGVPGHVKEIDHPVYQQKFYYEQNVARNKRIAQIVNHDKFRNEQILIMVKTLAHAEAIQQELPNYEIVSDTSRDESKTATMRKKETAKQARRFRKGTLKKAISTMVWKEGVDFPDLRVLVRADGGTSEIANIQIPGRTARISGPEKNFAALIDFRDNFCADAKRRSDMRRESYRERGWEIYDIK